MEPALHQEEPDEGVAMEAGQGEPGPQPQDPQRPQRDEGLAVLEQRLDG